MTPDERHTRGDGAGRLIAATPSIRSAARAMIRATSAGSAMTRRGVRRRSSAIFRRMDRASAGIGSTRGAVVTLDRHLQLSRGTGSADLDAHPAALPVHHDPGAGQGAAR
jgi:hypothetical protein